MWRGPILLALVMAGERPSRIALYGFWQMFGHCCSELVIFGIVMLVIEKCTEKLNIQHHQNFNKKL